MGRIKTSPALCLLMSVASIAVVFACTDATNTSSIRVSSAQSPHPSHCLIICRNLEGYMRDCGCTGEDVGGIARLPNVLPNGVETTYLFVGNIFSEPTTNPEVAVRTLVQTRDEWSAILSELGNVWMAPAPREENFATEAGLDLPPSVRLIGDDGIVQWKGGIRVHMLSDGTVRLGTQAATLHEIVPNETVSRLRNIYVVCLWSGSTGNAWPVWDARAGTLYSRWSLAKLAGDEQLLLSTLQERQGSVVSGYRKGLGKLVSQTPALLDVADRYEMSFLHGRVSVVTPDQHTSESPSCSTCHKDAEEAWRRSRHSHSLETLAKLGKESDSRCVKCHVNAIGVSAATSIACRRCHDGDNEPKDVCAECHTDVTDPEQHYLLGLHRVCVSPRNPGKRCPER